MNRNFSSSIFARYTCAKLICLIPPTPPPLSPTALLVVCVLRANANTNANAQELMRHFPCERGCQGGVQGDDIPNYVSSAQKPEYHRFCLTTDGPSRCGAKHVTA